MNTFAGGLDAVLALPGTEDLQGSSPLAIFDAGSQVFESSDQTEGEYRRMNIARFTDLVSVGNLTRKKDNLASWNVIKLVFDKRRSSNRPPSGNLCCIRHRGEYKLNH